MVLKGIKLRIYPNQEQQTQIKMNFGYNRFVWNKMLNMMIKRYENNPEAPFLNAFTLNNLLPSLKIEYPWLKKAESTSLQATNHDLVESYKKFFKEHSGFPKFKSRKFPKQSYTSKMGIRLINEHQIKLPKLGLMRFKCGQIKFGKIKNVTIRLSSAGKFYAILLVDTDIAELVKTNHFVGIDMGVADLMITSDGVKYPTIRFDKALSRKKHYWEKRLARRRLQAMKEIAWDHHNKVAEPRELSDFSNYLKAKHMVAKYSEKITNQRNNYLHNLTKQLVEQYDVIKIEDLKTKNLLRNHKLARAIANQSWRELRSQLEYKCEWYGKQLVTVNPRKTSQICSDCGYDDGKHTLDIRQWTCPKCGVQHDRDINAAKNILSA
ncbi:transposase, IS605 OrfB family [Levilactobacillus senmaizukei DSM 21775 = NBRC 103853]|uniref:Transposase, IS605 OrfB family n=1 Tax=Levilactobacillus senmaizukei DSM 21775 = NBRC 103853 TaxID=1423803 RepID=A0A0R2DBJ2_9LACO|nr:RNA-guided endonuclease TnpB family protein [Levilactobacillus senmaizukei]KRN01214.1 transposase, IS605 OrfB family [Levilactobacillus senmaizukei DSM 21775 = NBRC 103853]